MTFKRPEVLLPPEADYALRIKHCYSVGWEQWYLLISDCHWDSPECYIRLLHRHLREARERNALIIDNGDFFDVISGRGDKRGSKGTHRDEFNKTDYLDQLVYAARDEFEPYRDLFAYMGTGNHEQSITINKETDLASRLIRDHWNPSREKRGLAPIHRAGYTGWIRFMFERGGTKRFSHKMKLEHGTGGNAPVTKGVIQTNRRQVRTEGATFFVSGHIHEQFDVPIIVERLNESSSRIEQRKVSHLQLASYKMDFRPDGVATWSMMTSGTPKPIGGKWLRFFSRNGDDIEYEVTDTWVDYANLPSYLRKAKVVVPIEKTA